MFWQLPDLHEECQCGDDGLWWLTKHLPKWLSAAVLVVGEDYESDLLFALGDRDVRYSSFFKAAPTPFMVYLLFRWGDPSIKQRNGANRSWVNRSWKVLDSIAASICEPWTTKVGDSEVRMTSGVLEGFPPAGDGEGGRDHLRCILGLARYLGSRGSWAEGETLLWVFS